jgi:hypothetical protein
LVSLLFFQIKSLFESVNLFLFLEVELSISLSENLRVHLLFGGFFPVTYLRSPIVTTFNFFIKDHFLLRKHVLRKELTEIL